MSLRELFNRMTAELGIEISFSPPPSDLLALPASLRDLYALTDGVSLPFAEFLPSAEFRSQSDADYFGPGWTEFGFDRYFTYYLVASDPDAADPGEFRGSRDGVRRSFRAQLGRSPNVDTRLH